MARLYGDEDFDHLTLDGLRSLGHDVLTVRDAGQGNQGIEDLAVLAFATSQGRAVLTFNRRDFIRLHRQSPAHQGIIVRTRDPDASALANRIHLAMVACSGLDGQLIRVNRPPQS